MTSSRYNEYQHIFLNFIEKCEKEKAEKIIVITGDIFHDKSKIDAPGIKLFCDFINAFIRLKIKVFIIRGNHDYKQWDKSEIDMITSLLTPFSYANNIVYLNSTGSYYYEDLSLHFGVLAIQDYLEDGNTSSIAKNCNAKVPMPNTNAKYNIGLFHGDIPYINAFKGYDYAMLGDVHERRVWTDNNGTVCGFAGSMIRQNKGESVTGHGYLRWDLSEGEVKGYDIKNPYDTMRMHKNVKETANALKRGDCSLSSLQVDQKDYLHFLQENAIPNDYLQYIINPESHLLLTIPDFIINGSTIKKLKDRNDRILNSVSAYESSHSIFIKKKINLNFIEIGWDWILCYGANNKFDFTKIKDVFCIDSGNATGKTSFMEILVISLYGTGFPSRTSKAYSSSIINKRIPLRSKAKTSLTFKINGDMYTVVRSFTDNKNKLNASKDTFLIAEDTNSKIRSGKTAVDAWINENVGPLTNLLLTSIQSQNSDCDFFSMNAQDQRICFDNSIKINNLNYLIDMLKESKLAHKFLIDIIEGTLGDENAIVLDEDYIDYTKVQKENNLPIPDFIPTVLHPKDYYIEKCRDQALYNALENIATSVETEYENSEDPRKLLAEYNNYTVNYKAIVAIPSNLDGATWDAKLFKKLHEKFKNIEYPYFSHTKYNNRCKICQENKSKSIVFDDYIEYLHLLATHLHFISGKVKYHYDNELSSIHAQLNTFNYVITNYEAIYIQHKINAQAQTNNISNSIKYIKKCNSKIDCINAIIQGIKSFNTWHYTKNVLPKFTKLINDYLFIICDGDGMHNRDCKVSSRLNEKQTIDWFLNDIPIQKASGYQKFATSMAFRMAFSGLLNVQTSCLMIDEGFNTCDVQNKESIKVFINNIKNISSYRSMILISHALNLDEYQKITINVSENSFISI